MKRDLWRGGGSLMFWGKRGGAIGATSRHTGPLVSKIVGRREKHSLPRRGW